MKPVFRLREAALALFLFVPSGRALAEQPINPMHPPFKPLTREGSRAQRLDEVATDVTCGTCHDANYVRSHDAHASRSTATCIDCHVDPTVSWAELDENGLLPRSALRIGAPRASHCARCHGVISEAAEPVVLPEYPRLPEPHERTASLTLAEGAIVSGESIQSSFVNVAGRSTEPGPWDVHAAKLVDCVGCHHAANNPARIDVKKEKLAYVYADPRRPSTAEFLHRPDHRLVSLDCRACHDASNTHAFLPYPARHFEKLACESCHVRAPLGPTAEMIDETTLTARGEPLVRYRNRANTSVDATNAAWTEALRPALVLRRTPLGAARLTPVNLISRFRWVSGTEPVARATLRRALFDGEHYAADILSAFDENKDGALSADELRLDTKKKVELVRARLRSLGVVDPVIGGDIEVHALVHGVPSRAKSLRDCAECHSEASRFGGERLLASYLPGGITPRWPTGGGFTQAGGLRREGNRLFLTAAASPILGVHVLGFSRAAWSNTLGFGIFLAVALGLVGHAGLRFALRGRRGPTHRASHAEREYVFGRYERFWHWTMAGAGIALLATGIVIHGGASEGTGLAKAVWVHNAAAIILMTNAFLGFFYHSATAAIRNFIPESKGLLRRVLEHVDYQTRGIFYGNPHPRNAPGSKLNPLQQVTYLALLNFLFPLQIVTGVVMWALGEWPALGDRIGALTAVAPIHNFGSWLFLTFFVLHVYLVTTGRTLGEHLVSMLTGYREAASPNDEPAANSTDSTSLKA